MSSEEMWKAIEFLIEQQAQFVARMEKDEGRLTRLEDAFVTLVELAKATDERMDKADQRIDTFDEKMAALLEAQAHTDERLNALIDVLDGIIRKNNNGSSIN